jgi:Flp pilus assembly protein TadB
MSEQDKKTKRLAATLLGSAIGLALILAYPLLLLWGLSLLGMSVGISLKSYLGAVLLIIFISSSVKLANTPIKPFNSEQDEN